MKVLENCENVVRNRKSKVKITESTENKPKCEIEEKKFDTQEKIEKFVKTEKVEAVSEIKNENFMIKIEFDPMSIFLFILAIVTRFFRLAEPKNVV